MKRHGAEIIWELNSELDRESQQRKAKFLSEQLLILAHIPVGMLEPGETLNASQNMSYSAYQMQTLISPERYSRATLVASLVLTCLVVSSNKSMEMLTLMLTMHYVKFSGVSGERSR